MKAKDCYEEFNTNCEFGELEELSNGWDKVICKKCGHPTFLTPTVETIARDGAEACWGDKEYEEGCHEMIHGSPEVWADEDMEG